MCDFDGNPYRILGVKRTASQAEIKAVPEKARETHPDKNPENQERAEKMFRDVAGAYELLSDDERGDVTTKQDKLAAADRTTSSSSTTFGGSRPTFTTTNGSSKNSTLDTDNSSGSGRGKVRNR